MALGPIFVASSFLRLPFDFAMLASNVFRSLLSFENLLALSKTTLSVSSVAMIFLAR
jgi:hypothetical protein